MTIVNITQDDIDNGIRGMSHACAIAQGLKRVDVFSKEDLQTIWVNGSQLFRVGSELYMLPKKAQNFIKQFDADKSKSKPFTFALRKYKGPATAGPFIPKQMVNQYNHMPQYITSSDFSFKY